MEEKSKLMHIETYSHKKDRSSITIDVVIISRNRPDKLFRAACSLVSNSIVPNSIIIIDSSDTMWWYHSAFYRLCKRVSIDFAYKHVNTPGVSSQRNMGIRLSTGDIVAFLDDDEIAPVEWIATMLRIFYEGPARVAITGPRRPHYRHNYWNNVWDKIQSEEHEFTGYRDYIFGDNACYRRNFIVRNNLFFDPRMKISSEDVYFSSRILLTGARIYFSQDLYVYHDFRTDFLSFMRQWFYYGVGTSEFHYYHIIGERLDSGRVGLLWHALVTSTRWTWLIPSLDTPMFFVLLCRDSVFLLGYTVTLLKLLFYRQRH